MPIYEYQCKKCGHRFERIQRMADASVNECPECKGEVERLISASAVQFKGSGFYKTDYAPKSGGGSSSDSKPESKAGSTSESSGSSEAATSAGAAKPAETTAAPAPKPDKK